MFELAIHLRLCGLLLMGLAALHLFFPRYFGWAQDLGQLTLINRQMFYIHCFFLCVTLTMMGALSFWRTSALLTRSELGAWTAAGFCIFWQLRLLIQHFGYDASLWRSKPFETCVHVVFTLLWGYLTAIYGWLWWFQCH